MQGIVIGAGPSVTDNLWLLYKVRELAEQNPDLLVFSCGHMLKECLDHDIPPGQIIAGETETDVYEEWMPEPPCPLLIKYYRNIPKDTAKQIRVHLSCQLSKIFYEIIESWGFQMKAPFHRAFLPCKRMIDDQPHPSFREGFNVGAAMIHIAYNFYHCRDIYTIGLDFELDNKHGRRGELENTMIGLTDLTDRKLRIYNCNPNQEGHFYSPLRIGTLDMIGKPPMVIDEL